jgi:hypothetical protein
VSRSATHEYEGLVGLYDGLVGEYDGDVGLIAREYGAVPSMIRGVSSAQGSAVARPIDVAAAGQELTSRMDWSDCTTGSSASMTVTSA